MTPDKRQPFDVKNRFIKVCSLLSRLPSLKTIRHFEDMNKGRKKMRYQISETVTGNDKRKVRVFLLRSRNLHNISYLSLV